MATVAEELTLLNTRVAQLLAGVQISKNLMDSVSPNAIQVALDAGEVATNLTLVQAAKALVDAAAAVTVAAKEESIAAKNAAKAFADASGSTKIYDTLPLATAALANIANNEVVRVLIDGTHQNRQSYYRKEAGVLVFKAEAFEPSKGTALKARLGTDDADFMTALAVKNAIEARLPEILIDNVMEVNGVNYSTALGMAIDIADATGATITHRPGKAYFATTGVSSTDKNVTIRWNGATVFRAASAGDFTVLSLNYSFTNVVPVVALATESTVIGTGAETTKVSRIQVANGSLYKEGDIAKIVSDDPISWSIPSLGERLGETFEVAKVVGNYIYLSRLLRIAPVTNIRLAKLTRKVVDLDLCHVEDEVGSPATRNDPAIRIQGAVMPVLHRPIGRNLNAEAFFMVSCYRTKITDGDGYKIRTSIANTSYGYLVVESAGCDTEISGMSAARLRHAFTTRAADNVAANSPDIWRYGGCLGTKIKNGHAVEVGHAAWDFHDDAAYGEYSNCSVTNNFREPDGSFVGFKLRGKGHIIRDCTSTGPGGVNSQGQDGGAGYIIENHLHIIPPGVEGATAFFLTNDDMTYRGKCSLSGKVVGTNYNNGETIILRNQDIDIPDLTIELNAQGTLCRPFNLTNTLLRIGTLRVDLRGSNFAGMSSGNIRLFRFLDALSEVFVERLIVRTAGGAWVIADLGGFDAKCTIGTLEADTLPSSYQGGFTGAGAAAIHWVRDIILNGEKRNEGIRTITGNTAFSATSIDAHTVMMTEPITNNCIITEPFVGIYPGREMTYIRDITSTGAYSWQIGTENLSVPGAFVVRKWSGTAWFTKSRGSTV